MAAPEIIDVVYRITTQLANLGVVDTGTESTQRLAKASADLAVRQKELAAASKESAKQLGSYLAAMRWYKDDAATISKVTRDRVEGLKNELKAVENLSKAERELKSAKSGLGTTPTSPTTVGTSGKTGSVSSALHPYALMFAARETSQFITESTKDTIDYANAIQLMSKMTGLASQNASVYALAAKEVGISNETVSESFRTFSDRMARTTDETGQMNAGSTALLNALDKLNISTTKTNGQMKSMDEMLPEIFQKFKELGAGVQTTQYATALFGRNADELMPLLLRGADGLDEVRKRAELLGLVLDDLSLNKLRESQKAIADWDAAWLGVRTTLISSIQPALTGIVPVIENISERASGAIVLLGSIGVGIRAATMGIDPIAVGMEYQRQMGYTGLGFYGGKVPSSETFSGKPLPGGPSLDYKPFGRENGKLDDQIEKLREKIASAQDKQSQPSGGGQSAAEKAKESQAKLDQDLSDMLRDYMIKDTRARTDYDRKVEDRRKKHNEVIYELEKTQAKKREDFNAKWDDIMLHLQAGGDRDSIELAKQRRAEETSKQEEADKEDRAKVIEKHYQDMADTEWDFNEKRKREQEDYDLRRSDMLRDFQARLDDTQSYSSTRNQIEIQSVQKLNSELDTLENLRRLSVEYANKGILHDTISTYSQLDQIRDRWYNDPRVGGSGESQEGASRAFDC